MNLQLVRSAIFGATVLNGLLLGGVNRLVVDMPAWRQLGVRAWADFSRRADLGNGLVAYPLEGIGGTALSVLAALGYASARPARANGWPLYAAALCSLGGLLVTRQAAPRMLSLRHLAADDTPALQRAFDGFEFWSRIRACLQVTAWLCNVWSLASLAGR